MSLSLRLLPESNIACWCACSRVWVLSADVCTDSYSHAQDDTGLVHMTLVRVTFARGEEVRTAALVCAHSRPSMHPPQAQATQGREKLQVVPTVGRCTVPPTLQLWCTRLWYMRNLACNFWYTCGSGVFS